MDGLFQAVGILVAGTVLLYAATLALGALGDRRTTRARLSRLRRTTAGAEHDHQHVAARHARSVSIPGSDHAQPRQAEPLDARLAQRVLDQLRAADAARTAVTVLMGGDDPDLTHRGEEIDSAVASYRDVVDKLTATWSACSTTMPTADGPGPVPGVQRHPQDGVHEFSGHPGTGDPGSGDPAQPAPNDPRVDVAVPAG